MHSSLAGLWAAAVPRRRCQLFKWCVEPGAGGRAGQPQRFYVEQLATMKERELKCLYVNYEHVFEYDQVRRWGRGGGCGAGWSPVCRCTCLPFRLPRPPRPHHPPAPCNNQSALPLPPAPQSLAANITEAYYRLEPFLRAAVRSFVREHLDTFAENEDGSDKQFWLSFYGLPDNDKLRSLRSAKIGKLSQFVGTVTRTTDVRPELFTGTFRCMECMTGAPGGGAVCVWV